MPRKLRDVCHEPEPVARVWKILREELGFYLLHDQRQRVYDVIAHDIADQIRRERDETNIPGSPATPDFIRGMGHAADIAEQDTET